MTTIYYTPQLLIADRQVRTGHNILTIKDKIVPITHEQNTIGYAAGIGNSSAVAALIEYLEQSLIDAEFPFPEWIEPETALVLYVSATVNEDGRRKVMLYDASPYPIEMDSTKSFALGASADFINQYTQYHNIDEANLRSVFGMAIGMPIEEWKNNQFAEYMTHVGLQNNVMPNRKD